VDIDREQPVQPVLLSLGEQVTPGVQSAARGVQRVAFVTTVPPGGLLDTAQALIQGVPLT
jgi:hypothetical protein